MSKIILDCQDLNPIYEELEKAGYQGSVKDLLILLQKQTFQSQRRFFYMLHLPRIKNKQAQQWLTQWLSKADRKFEQIEINHALFSDNNEIYIHLGPCVSSLHSRHVYIYGFSHQSGYALRCIIAKGKKEREKTFIFNN